MPAPSYIGSVNSTDATIGAGADETGILLNDLSVELENPEVVFRDRYSGETGYAVNFNPKLNYTVSGEVTDKDAGINVMTFVAAATPANEEFFASSTSTHNGIDFASADCRLTGANCAQPAGDARTITVNISRPLGFSF